ncbi:MAG: thiamine-phosphate kinase [Thermoleophilia bacterium]
MLVGELGEEALLDRLRRLFSSTAAAISVGIGDDAAVTGPAAGMQVWTTDLLLEGVHFRKDWQAPEQLGHKCLAVNLSDMAAMGAVPRYALLTIACAGDTPVDLITGICEGIASLAAKTGTAVVGGDTTGSPGPLALSVSLAGELEAGEAPVLRSGAHPGDRILVTGRLGGAAGGLRLSQQGSGAGFPQLLTALNTPVARLAEGHAARLAGAAAMTDISDGLATDLRHMCAASGTGARIRADAIPVYESLPEAAGRHGWELQELVIYGGEDYELLIAAPPDKAGRIAGAIEAAGTPVTDIGQMTAAAAGIVMLDPRGAEQPLAQRGFDHFRR